jgi:hypothetical protein
MRIAYGISAYKNPAQLERLVRRLHAGPAETTFLIHVDSKTSRATFETMTGLLADLDGVRFLPRHACYWGGFGHVEASLKVIDAAITDRDEPGHLILLSGQDYPIKSNAAIAEFLRAGKDRSYFLHFPLPTENWSHGGIDRIERWHLRRGRLHLQLPRRRRLPPSLALWGGSAYWILSREAVHTISAFLAGNPWYVRYFRHVDIPDEIFFQTILLNSAEAERCVQLRLHHTEWERTPAPAILTVEDYPRLAESPCLFARKFDENIDAEVLDLIDDGLLADVGRRA